MISKSHFPKTISIIFLFSVIVFVIFSVVNKDFSFIYWLAFLILPIAILLFFGNLKVSIDDVGIHYTMFPFVNKQLAWGEIENYEIVKISPLGDFMGWGFRYSSKYGWSYIFDTKYAIAIQKKNGKKLALSINDKDKAMEYLKSIGEL